MHDYSNGYEATEVETRSAYDKMNDKNYIFQTLRDKIINLFNNDAETSDDFMSLLAGSNITPEEFEIAYEQLMTNFSGKLATPDDVMTNLRQLVDNFKDTGVSNQPAQSNQSSALVSYDPDNIKQLIQDAMQTVQTGYDNEIISTEVAQDNMDKLEAFNAIMRRLQSLMSQPFAQDYDQDQKDGMFAYARNKKALKDIVEILSSGRPEETNSTQNLEQLIGKLEQVKEATFKRWAKNANLDLKDELSQVTAYRKQERKKIIEDSKELLKMQNHSRAKRNKAKDKRDNINQELNDELDELRLAYKNDIIVANPDAYLDHVLGPRCKDCGHHYITHWKHQHDKTERHNQDKS